MASLRTMTKDQRSLLLYLETCATDHGGTVDTRHMNAEDMLQAREWSDLGLITFGRRGSEFFTTLPPAKQRSHRVVLSDSAWELAHEERRARNTRMRTKLANAGEGWAVCSERE